MWCQAFARGMVLVLLPCEGQGTLPDNNLEVVLFRLEEQLGGGRLLEESGQWSERGRLATRAAAVEQSRTGELEGSKQGTERSGMIAFGFEGVPQSGQVEGPARNVSIWCCSRRFWRVLRSCLASLSVKPRCSMHWASFCRVTRSVRVSSWPSSLHITSWSWMRMGGLLRGRVVDA